MQENEIKDITEPTEITQLKEVLSNGYPNTDISYKDYTNIYETLEGKGIDISPQMHNDEDLEESYIYPIGRVGGHYRAELLVHASKSALPDPTNSDNKLLIYPSFNKENNLSKLRILRYPNKVIDDIKSEFNKEKLNLKLPDNNSRLKALPKIKYGIKDPKSNDTLASEAILNSSEVLMSKYSSERIERLKNKVQPLQWGNHSLLPYKNNDGENILLTIEN